ncbi:MAG: hypothetical protein NC127_09685, partial [Muribaculum sp.]|nr:hypothetical protein [Muribaculum sp.]
MKRNIAGFIFTFFAAIHFLHAAESYPMSNRALLNMLDRKVSERNVYASKIKLEYDSLKLIADSVGSTSVEIYDRLGKVATKLNSDTAIMVYTKGIEIANELGDSVAAQRFVLLRADAIRILGVIPDAIGEIERVEESGVYPENQRVFYQTARDIYLGMAELYEGRDKLFGTYLQKGLECAKRQLTFFDAGSPEADIAQALVYYAQGKKTMSIAQLHDVVGGF